MFHQINTKLRTLSDNTLRSMFCATLLVVFTGPALAFPDFKTSLAAADAGEPKSKAIAATCYALGWQTEKDLELAARYAQQSAQCR